MEYAHYIIEAFADQIPKFYFINITIALVAAINTVALFKISHKNRKPTAMFLFPVNMLLTLTMLADWAANVLIEDAFGNHGISAIDTVSDVLTCIFLFLLALCFINVVTILHFASTHYSSSTKHILLTRPQTPLYSRLSQFDRAYSKWGCYIG